VWREKRANGEKWGDIGEGEGEAVADKKVEGPSTSYTTLISVSPGLNNILLLYKFFLCI
jgi:hypothetical protein